MAGIDQAIFAQTAGLPEHRRVLEAVLGFFQALPRATGAWTSGSTARGGMDEFSDLDVGILFGDEDEREQAWEARWDWEIAPWFHRFDADHVKPHFVIYLFEPTVKTDISLHLASDLPPPRGGPYVVAWDETGALADWAAKPYAEPSVDWAAAAHEEERFWAWTYYAQRHLERGEYYEVATELHWLREIVETWTARLAGRPVFEYRRAESRYDLGELARTFPEPDREALKLALLGLIELHERQRRRVAATWRTTEEARRRIRALVEGL